jgi:Flp pilus assembly pilin Flp
MLLKKLGNVRRKGQAMVEYALLVVCIAVVGAVATSMLGHKTADTLGVAASIMPGAHTDDNHPINTAQAVPTTLDANGNIVIDTSTVSGIMQADRFSPILGSAGASLVIK